MSAVKCQTAFDFPLKKAVYNNLKMARYLSVRNVQSENSWTARIEERNVDMGEEDV